VPISGANYAWKVGTPVFSVAAGTYTTEKTVVVTCATPGATIHYTLDGAEPTESDPTVASGGTVVIDQSRTLKAHAWNGTAPASEIASAVYTLQVATVTFSPGSGTYTSAPTVTLATTTSGATIRYTTDGSTPTGMSPAYSGPFVVPTTTTVRAAGFRTGWTAGSVNAATYTMNFGILAAPTFSPGAGAYVSSISVTLSAAAGASIRYTTNGSTPNTGSPLYTVPLELAATTTLKAIALHPDYTTSPVATAVFAIEVAAPAFSPTGGTYAAGQSITVSTATSGATIRYTTNGLEPTESDASIASGDTLPIGTFTLKAKAFKAGATTSATTTASYTVTGTVTTAKLAGGDAHSLAVRADGLAFVWGHNASGQVGDGSTAMRVNPILVSGLSGILELDGGYGHSVAVRSDGRVLTWGENSQGQLGTGSGPGRAVPALITGLTSVVAVSAGRDHTLALKSDGTVVAWGANTSGQLGNGGTTQQATPVAVSGLSSVADVSAGQYFSLALTQRGTVYAWGSNGNGQLGLGDTTQRTTPVQIAGLTGVVAIAAGGVHALALKSDGTIRAWGFNTDGQVGDGSTTQRTAPVSVTGVSTAAAIAAGYSHSLALLADGSVAAWGSNLNGQLGNGLQTSSTTPIAVTGLTSVLRIAAATSHSLALRTGDEAWAWGRNVSGQVGNSLTVTSQSGVLAPQAISGANLCWKVWTPTLSVASGVYSTDQTVVGCADPLWATAPTLRYTTTGIDPTESDTSLACGASLAVTQSQTLKVRGWRTGAPASEVGSAAYTLKVVTPAIAPGTGAYGTAQNVTLSTSTAGATITYTVDGSEPTTSSTSYASAVSVASTLTLKARGYKTGWTPSDSAAASYWISAGSAAVPTITPAAGTFTDSPLITLSSATAGATIRYTLDGSEPAATSVVYAYPFLVSVTTTVKAKAFKAGLVPSATTTAAYQVDAAGATATPTLSLGGGRFTTRQTVTVTGPSGATLRYSTTGVDPTDTDTTIASGAAGRLRAVRGRHVRAQRDSALRPRRWHTGRRGTRGLAHPDREDQRQRVGNRAEHLGTTRPGEHAQCVDVCGVECAGAGRQHVAPERHRWRWAVRVAGVRARDRSAERRHQRRRSAGWDRRRRSVRRESRS